jgi:hypothetical protein
MYGLLSLCVLICQASVVWCSPVHNRQITTPPRGCHANGKWYQPGETISRGQSGNWCYMSMCDQNGQVIHGDDFNCGTTPQTTIPLTTIPLTTIPPGCFQNGHYYHPGQTIDSGQSGNWCYMSMCDQNGQIISGDNFNCYPTTPITTIPSGYCYLNGNYYAPGHVVPSGTEGERCHCQHGQAVCETPSVG